MCAEIFKFSPSDMVIHFQEQNVYRMKDLNFFRLMFIQCACKKVAKHRMVSVRANRNENYN